MTKQTARDFLPFSEMSCQFSAKSFFFFFSSSVMDHFLSLQQTYMGQKPCIDQPCGLAKSDCCSLVLPLAGCKSQRELCFFQHSLLKFQYLERRKVQGSTFILQHKVAFMIRKNKTKNYYLLWALADDLRALSFVSLAVQQRGEKAAAGWVFVFTVLQPRPVTLSMHGRCKTLH